MNAAARAGERLVAVGVRGLVALSDDAGASWRQAGQVPAASDLTSVCFVDERIGWAGGHDGLILHTRDGGASWQRQLDGRSAAPRVVEPLAAAAARGDAAAARLLPEMRRNYEHGPEQPVLDLWFESPERGWAAGAFGILLGTEDGGRHWVSWADRVDAEQAWHYHAVRGIGGEVYLASERGLVFRLDRAAGRFRATETGYGGSWFGLLGRGDDVLAFGLQGTLARSRDSGGRWQLQRTGVAVGLNGGAWLPDGRLLLVTQDGRLLLSRDDGTSFEAVPGVRPTILAAVLPAAPGRVLLAGLAGLQVVDVG